jgi:hypothetical protein
MTDVSLSTSHFFGDGKKTFRLTAPLIVELERKTGTGIGSITKRLFANEFTFGDVREVIRLGLIGGGEKPERAEELVAAYVDREPLGHSYSLAVSLLETAFFGSKQNKEAANA